MISVNVTLKIRDKVRVEGHHEVFRVVGVDAATESVDLACIERVGCLCRIPLCMVRPVNEH